jgi:hypothetical protein
LWQRRYACGRKPGFSIFHPTNPPNTMRNTKDKRTKEQILALLDRALGQEERLGEKIQELEQQVAEWRKKAEDPRQAVAEEALHASKISFRIDFYRSSAEGPLKGLVEHLPSRSSKSFSNEPLRQIARFMGKYLPELQQAAPERPTEKKAKQPAVEAALEASAPAQADAKPQAAAQPRLMERLLADFQADQQAGQWAH